MTKQKSPRYSDWQLMRIRHALYAYYMYEYEDHSIYEADGWLDDDMADEEEREDFKKKKEGEKKNELAKLKNHGNWEDLRNAIHDYTGVYIGGKIDGEYLRQFSVGNKIKKTGETKYPKSNPETLTVICQFLMHEDIESLTEEELNEPMPNYHAALRMVDFLHHDLSYKSEIPMKRLEGIYRAAFIKKDEIDKGKFIIKELTLQQSTEIGIIKVIEIEYRLPEENINFYKTWPGYRLQQGSLCRVVSAGWAVLSPDDYLTINLKKESGGQNCQYVMVSTDLSNVDEKPLSKMTLLQNTVPYDFSNLEDDNFLVHSVSMIEFRSNLFLYTRAGSPKDRIGEIHI